MRQSRERGLLVHLSGSGADETHADYGFGGEKFVAHSSFGGLFPRSLSVVFPWESFFLGTQRDFLMKEEVVGGAHGIESRYPFLDPQLVQEFLWLHDEVKNSEYKKPIFDYLSSLSYTIVRGRKQGFVPQADLREGTTPGTAGNRLVMMIK